MVLECLHCLHCATVGNTQSTVSVLSPARRAALSRRDVLRVLARRAVRRGATRCALRRDALCAAARRAARRGATSVKHYNAMSRVSGLGFRVQGVAYALELVLRTPRGTESMPWLVVFVAPEPRGDVPEEFRSDRKLCCGLLC